MISKAMTSCVKSDDQFIQSIQLFDVFDDPKGYNILVVTDKHLVYGLGSNSRGSLGLGHNLTVNSLTIIRELCYKNILQFYIGPDFVLAKCANRHVYGWGSNERAQLARKPTNDFCEPVNIPALNNRKVCQISCGYYHALALTKEGGVYGWGDNSKGQVGAEHLSNNIVLEPIKLRFADNGRQYAIKSVFCGHFSSFAITGEGLVFSWGRNDCYNLGHMELGQVCTPRLIADLTGERVVGGVVGHSGASYLYTDKDFVYFCGEYRECDGNDVKVTKYGPILLDPYGIIKGIRVLKTNSGRKVIMVLDWTILEFNDIRPNIATYTNLFDYCMKGCRVTFKTIGFGEYKKFNFSKKRDFKQKCRQFLSDMFTKIRLSITDVPVGLSVINDRYEKLGKLGSGSFGKVYKMRNKRDGKEYAVKKIYKDKTDSDQYYKELQNLVTVRSEYCIQYIHALECDNYYIVMELCSDSLQTILDKKHKTFGRELGQPMSSVEAFISCQIFKELLECVQYLHGLKPPVTHGDLYPDNILMTRKAGKGRYFKLCDFGVSTVRPHASDKGNPSYQAPEIYHGRLYDHKVDLYSLYRIGEKLFDVNLDYPCSQSYSSHNEIVNKCMDNVKQVLHTMSYYNWEYPNQPKPGTHDWTDRPSCWQVLDKYKEWTLCNQCLQSDPNVESTVNAIKQNSYHFFGDYFVTKYRINILFEAPLGECMCCTPYEDDPDDPMYETYQANKNQTMASGSESDPQLESIESIQLFHVFQDPKGYNILVVTDKGLVYGLGSNSRGCLGLGHKRVVNTATIIPKLCDKNIVQFCTGHDICVAISSSGRVYEWKKWMSYKPIEVSGFEDQQVCEISCGYDHSLALTGTGSVYEWGDHIYRCNNFDGYIFAEILSPQRLHFYANKSNVDNEYHIKSVFCGHFSSFAITDEGLVFSWGRNECYQLGHKVLWDKNIWHAVYQEGVVSEPQLVAHVTRIKSIATGSRATYWLRNDGFVYFCGQYNDQSGAKIIQNEPILLDNIADCQELRMIWANDKHKAIALINDRVVEIDGMNGVKQTHYKNLFDYCLDVYRVTPETMSVVDNNYYEFLSEMFKMIQLGIIFIPGQLHSGRTPISQYENLSELGTGSFGTVYKMRNKGNGRIYAIKKIATTGRDKTDLAQIFKELENLMRVRSQYCVRYVHSFYDLDYYYIVMELCSDSLQTILDKKHKAFGRELGQPMGIVEAYISCHIFKEILKCVQYLHGLTPPVTHGDLYPANILISPGVGYTCYYSRCNGSHFKICDFGLTTIRQHKSSRLGNDNYQAPEVGRGEFHNHKADLFSIYKIGEQLFDVDLSCLKTDASLSYSSDNELVNKCMVNVMKVLQSMSYYNWDHPKNPDTLHWKDRRECSEVLETYKEWTLCNQCLLSGPYVFDAISYGIDDSTREHYYEFFYHYLMHIIHKTDDQETDKVSCIPHDDLGDPFQCKYEPDKQHYHSKTHQCPHCRQSYCPESKEADFGVRFMYLLELLLRHRTLGVRWKTNTV